MILNLLLYNFLHGERVTQLWDINVFILSVFNDGPTFVFIESLFIIDYIFRRLMWSIHLNTRIGINWVVVLKASKFDVIQIFLYAPSKNTLNIKMIGVLLLLSVSINLLFFFIMRFIEIKALFICFIEYLLRLLIHYIFLLIHKALLDFKKNIIASHCLP